jgi:hypothetical protein
MDTAAQINEHSGSCDLCGHLRCGQFCIIPPLPKGKPSHDTFRRVFRLIDAEGFRGSFVSWVQSLPQLIGGQVIGIDGKSFADHRTTGSGAELELVHVELDDAFDYAKRWANVKAGGQHM